MQVRPCDRFIRRTSGQPPLTEAFEHPMESDLDRKNFKLIIGGSRQRHVGHPSQAVPHHIDDLCVEHVTTQQQLVGFELRAHRTGWESIVQCTIDQLHPVMFELNDLIPADKNRNTTAQLHEKSRHERRFSLPIQPDSEINDPPERGTFGGVDLLTGGTGEPEHGSSMATLDQKRRLIVVDSVAIRQENKGEYRPDEGDTGGDETADGHAIHERR